MNRVYKQLIYRVRDKAQCTAVAITKNESAVGRWIISNGVHNTETAYARSFVYRKLNVYQNDTN